MLTLKEVRTILVCRGNVYIYTAALCLHLPGGQGKEKPQQCIELWLRDADTSRRNSVPDLGTVYSKNDIIVAGFHARRCSSHLDTLRFPSGSAGFMVHIWFCSFMLRLLRVIREWLDRSELLDHRSCHFVAGYHTRPGLTAS